MTWTSGMSPIRTPPFWLRPMSDAIRDRANVLDFIPYPFIAAIRAGTSTDDVSEYLNNAHRASLEVYYPPGLYNAANVVVYPRQYVHGAWQASVLKQIGAASIFVGSDWLSNGPPSGAGRLIENLAFTTANPNAGGYAIIDRGYRDMVRNVHCTGLPILLTSITSDSVDQGATQGHSLDNLYMVQSPRGGLLTTGTVTDVVLSRSTFNACGAAGGAAAIDVSGTAGWQITAPKIFSCSGAVLRTPSVWNLLIEGGDIDWAGGDGIGLDLHAALPRDEGLRLIGNDFRIKASTPGTYTMVNFAGGPINLTHLGNKYFVDCSLTGPNVTAINLSGTAYAGHSGMNRYQGFTTAQIGNADALLP